MSIKSLLLLRRVSLHQIFFPRSPLNFFFKVRLNLFLVLTAHLRNLFLGIFEIYSWCLPNVAPKKPFIHHAKSSRQCFGSTNLYPWFLPCVCEIYSWFLSYIFVRSSAVGFRIRSIRYDHMILACFSLFSFSTSLFFAFANTVSLTRLCWAPKPNARI